MKKLLLFIALVVASLALQACEPIDCESCYGPLVGQFKR